MSREITWKLTDHICRNCSGGRVLRSVTGAGMTPGGNSIYRCADCGASGYATDEICWCGFRMKNQRDNGFICMSFSILKTEPELLNEFRACGCEPDRAEVGIIRRHAGRTECRDSAVIAGQNCRQSAGCTVKNTPGSDF